MVDHDQQGKVHEVVKENIDGIWNVEVNISTPVTAEGKHVQINNPKVVAVIIFIEI